MILEDTESILRYIKEIPVKQHQNTQPQTFYWPEISTENSYTRYVDTTSLKKEYIYIHHFSLTVL
jgi:hypothetical protein